MIISQQDYIRYTEFKLRDNLQISDIVWIRYENNRCIVKFRHLNGCFYIEWFSEKFQNLIYNYWKIQKSFLWKSLNE